jgi:1-deoxy-D-xylulose-5-phosphate synthase
MTLIAPRDTTELREMLFFMREYDKGPIAIRYPRGSTPENLPEGRTAIEFAKAEVLGSPSETKPQVTVVAVGSMVETAWEAATQLAAEGVSAQVVNARWIKPIDFDTVFALAAETGNLLTIEESARIGGFGQMVRDELVERDLALRHTIIALPDRFIDHGDQSRLLEENGLGLEDVKSAILNLAKARRP